MVYLNDELEYLEAKLQFLLFMSDKKRSVDEVQEFVSRYRKEISRRLESISLIKLNKEEIIKTTGEINSIKIDIKNKNKEIKDQKDKVKLIDKLGSSITKKSLKTTSLLSEVKEEFHNGIRIFNPEEIKEEQEEQELNTENE
jgi:uncharacterized protein YeeX (DUF496 family)